MTSVFKRFGMDIKSLRDRISALEINGGGVKSVNTKTGDVVLGASDVGADPAGTAAAAVAGKADTSALSAHTTRTDNPHSVTKAQIGLGNVQNLSPVNLPLSTAASTALAAKADLQNGLIPTSQLPAIATTETVFVASTAARLALTPAQVQGGDLVIENDTGRKYWCTGAADLTQANAWVRVDSDAAVVSVNGQVGIIVLGKADVGLDQVPNVDSRSRSTHTGTQSADTVDPTVDRLWMTASERTLVSTALQALVTRTSVSTTVMASRTAADTQDRWNVRADGRFSWGPGGGSATDTILYRPSFNTLRTAGGLIVDGDVTARSFLLSAAQSGVANGATRRDYVDAEIVNAKNRANHTGSQAADTITETDALKVMTAAERTKLAGLSPIVQMTQAAYDALATKDANTLYVIVG